MARGKATAEAARIEDAEEPKSIFDTIEVETRAGTFSFREIDGEEYDKCVDLSTDDETKRVNMIQLLRWLTTKSSMDGLTLEKLQKLPYKVREQVLFEVNNLYFPDNTEEVIERLQRMGYTVTAPEGPEAPNS